MIWIIQRIYSPGPLIFKQERGGLAGRPFTLLKFRTMTIRKDVNDQTRQAVHGDERVFRGAVWLRRHSIDEFPQFINVLVGTMSIVGPRPHLGVHDIAFSKISPEYRVRSFVKPGITGLAQVEGHRGPTPEDHHVNSRVKADLKYMENWTFKNDILLVIRTFLHVLHPTNAV